MLANISSHQTRRPLTLAGKSSVIKVHLFLFAIYFLPTATISLRQGLEPVDAKEAIPIGTVTITLLAILLILIILLDLNKLYSDLKMAHNNINELCSQRRNRKVTDSSLAIGEPKA